MLQDNIVFAQCIVFLAFGAVSAAMVNAMFGFPRRLIESS